MKKIKNYNQFCNEEINLKKALTGAALAGSLLLSPTKTIAGNDVLTNQDRIELAEVNQSETLFTRKITVSGTKKEIFRKVVDSLRANRGNVTVITQEKLTCRFTLDDVEPEGKNGFTNLLIDITISEGSVTFDFKKIDFFYSGMQPKSLQKQIGDDLKVKGIEVISDLTRKSIQNPYLGNRISSEIEKNKSNVYRAEQNFTYQQALNSRNPNHRSFIRDLNLKIDNILNSIR